MFDQNIWITPAPLQDWYCHVPDRWVGWTVYITCGRQVARAYLSAVLQQKLAVRLRLRAAQSTCPRLERHASESPHRSCSTHISRQACNVLQRCFASSCFATEILHSSHLFSRSMKHYVALWHQHDIIEEVVGLRGRLQQGYQQSALQDVAEVGEALGDEEGGCAVQACADLIHEQHLLAPHNDLTWTISLFKACIFPDTFFWFRLFGDSQFSSMNSTFLPPTKTSPEQFL